jgi:hypothetical protein
MERGLCSAPLLNFALRIMLGIINAKTYSGAINRHRFASKNISLRGSYKIRFCGCYLYCRPKSDLKSFCRKNITNVYFKLSVKVDVRDFDGFFLYLISHRKKFIKRPIDVQQISYQSH